MKREESGYYEAVGDSGNMTVKLHEIEIALKDQGFLVNGRQHIMYMLFYFCWLTDSPPPLHPLVTHMILLWETSEYWYTLWLKFLFGLQNQSWSHPPTHLSILVHPMATHPPSLRVYVINGRPLDGSLWTNSLQICKVPHGGQPLCITLPLLTDIKKQNIKMLILT